MIAYIGLGFCSAIYLALLFFGSSSGNFAITIFEPWVLITGFLVIPIVGLTAMISYQLFAKTQRFSSKAGAIVLVTIAAWLIALYLAAEEAAAAV